MYWLKNNDLTEIKVISFIGNKFNSVLVVCDEGDVYVAMYKSCASAFNIKFTFFTLSLATCNSIKQY